MTNDKGIKVSSDQKSPIEKMSGTWKWLVIASSG